MSRVPATTPTLEGDPAMTRNISTFRSIVTRCLAAGVLLCIYCIGIVGTSALVLAASSTTADARGGRRRSRRWWSRRRRLSRRWFSRRWLPRRRLPRRRLPWPRLGVGRLRRTGLLLQLSVGPSDLPLLLSSSRIPNPSRVATSAWRGASRFNMETGRVEMPIMPDGPSRPLGSSGTR